MATPIKWGGEFLVNTTTAGSQSEPAIAALADGRFLVAWTDDSESGGDTPSSAVRGQIFNADGSKSGGELLLNTTTADFQGTPTVAALSDGRFVVAWGDGSHSPDDPSGVAVRAQVFDVDGSKFGAEFLVNTTTTDDQFPPTITALAGGGFAVAWTDRSESADDPSGTAVRAQLFNGDGGKFGGEFLVNTTTDSFQGLATITALADGRFLAAWADASQGGGVAVLRGQVFNADGSKSGDELLLSTTTADDPPALTVAALADGRFVVVWIDFDESGGDTSGTALRAQVFNIDGSKSGSEFLVNTTTDSFQDQPTIAPLADGRFVVAWVDSSQSADDPSEGAVRAQVFNADGSKAGGEYLVNTTTAGLQQRPTITALADGRFAVAWGDFSGSADDPSEGAVRAQIFDPREAPVALAGTARDDDFVGTAFGDTLGGGHGNDHLVGAEGDDTLDGGAGADLMQGGAGDDFYFVDDPGDVVDETAAGSDGIDAVFAATSFSLADALRAKGDVENLTLTGIAAIDGTGNALANVVAGNAGANVLNGLGGNDTLIGQEGRDQFVFDTAISKDPSVNLDHITDFSHADDTIVLVKSVFKKLAFKKSGTLEKDAFLKGKKAEDDDDRIVYNKKTGEVFYDKDGEGGKKAIVFVVLDGSPDDVSHKDFLIVA